MEPRFSLGGSVCKSDGPASHSTGALSTRHARRSRSARVASGRRASVRLRLTSRCASTDDGRHRLQVDRQAHSPDPGVSRGGAMVGGHLSDDASRITTRDLAPDVRIRVWSTDTRNSRRDDWCTRLRPDRVRDRASGSVCPLTPGASPDTLEYPLTVSAGCQFALLDSGPNDTSPERRTSRSTPSTTVPFPEPGAD
jgi:hypothetical protein